MTAVPPGWDRTSAGVRLRELRWRDLVQVDRIERALFGRDAWSPGAWWAELAARPHTAYAVLVRESARAEADEDEDEDDGLGDGVVVGYAGLARSRPLADVMTIAVAPSARSRGCGRLLLDWLIGAAREAGAQALMLEVRADNEAARGLYAASGFEQVSVRRRYYQPDGVDALVLRRHLTTAETIE